MPDCTTCGGTGWHPDRTTCTTCRGTGDVAEARTVVLRPVPRVTNVYQAHILQEVQTAEVSAYAIEAINETFYEAMRRSPESAADLERSRFLHIRRLENFVDARNDIIPQPAPQPALTPVYQRTRTETVSRLGPPPLPYVPPPPPYTGR